MTAKHVKKGRFEYIYVEGFTTFASLQKPRKGYEDKGMEFSMNLFISKEDVDLLDEIPLNKQFFLVGVDKNKKKRIKFPAESHEGFEGLYGFNLNRPAKTKAGDDSYVTVIDRDRKPFKKLIGNGSKVKVKCYGWRNKEELLSIALDTVQVLEHVAYEESSTIEDDEFGGEYEKRTESAIASQSSEHEGFDDDDEHENDDDVPFSKAPPVDKDDPDGDKY